MDRVPIITKSGFIQLDLALLDSFRTAATRFSTGTE